MVMVSSRKSNVDTRENNSQVSELTALRLVHSFLYCVCMLYTSGVFVGMKMTNLSLIRQCRREISGLCLGMSVVLS